MTNKLTIGETEWHLMLMCFTNKFNNSMLNNIMRLHDGQQVDHKCILKV